VTETVQKSLTGKTRLAVAKATEYLCGRQSYNGGFCFYRGNYLDEPNLYDTFHAIAALTLAHATVPRIEALTEFLTCSAPAGVHGLYLYAFALDHLGRSSLIDTEHLARIASLPIPSLMPGGGLPTSGWLEETLKTLQLQKRLAAPPAGEQILHTMAGLRSRGGYGDKPNLLDTCLSLNILALFKENVAEQEETRAFVDDLQRPPIGFTGTADSLFTNLEVIDAGTQCCALLQLPVRYTADITAFVLACQTANGGFSRAPVALPDIALTHQALAIIHRVDPDGLTGGAR